jgi:hypothetical protein
MSTNRFHAKKKRYMKKSARKRLETIKNKFKKKHNYGTHPPPQQVGHRKRIFKAVKPHGQHYWIGESRKRKRG